MTTDNTKTRTAHNWVLGIDTGGTFTDFALLQNLQLRIHKVLSTPDSPERAILQGIEDLGIGPQVADGKVTIIHGSTVATNAALEGKGVKTAFISNAGFKDLLSIGRQTRRELYNLQPIPAQPPVPENLCFEISGRIDSNGKQIEKLTQEDLETLKQQLHASGIEAVAVNMLFSYLNGTPEQEIKQALKNDYFVSLSSEVLPESGEYERGIATWLNASLGPKVIHYLQNLQKGVSPSPLAIMQSTGGTMDAEQAGSFAVNMLLSGPAGGLAAAQFLGQQTGSGKLLTFDMGGTSTDVALVDGCVQLSNENRIGPWPVAVSQVDMHTIGAGGGSIAYCDAGGMLQVGPQSAGASPGPACYGKGGKQATVTDANAWLGRLQPEYFLGGDMNLDLEASYAAIGTLAQDLGLSAEETAHGIIRIANEHMVRALRVISIERGYHLDDFQLCSFGGAGGLHVCALADAMEMTQAIVPNYGGVLSALGMVVAAKSRQLSHSLHGLLQDTDQQKISTALRELRQQGISALSKEGIKPTAIKTDFSVDLRYQGQGFYLNQPWQEDLTALETAFHQQHEKRYGHRLAMPVETVNIRCQVSAAGAVSTLPTWDKTKPAQVRSTAKVAGFDAPIDVFWRPDLARGQTLSGPALIAETVSTTLLEKDWVAEVDCWGNLLFRKTQ